MWRIIAPSVLQKLFAGHFDRFGERVQKFIKPLVVKPVTAIQQETARFYTTKPGGLGLGLSICRSIIEAHNGRLWASANLPRGASFQFALPAIANTAS